MDRNKNICSNDQLMKSYDILSQNSVALSLLHACSLEIYWYDTDIVFINKELENIKFNGVLNKKQNIEHILLTIKATSNIDYEINDNKIMIK